MVEHHRECKVKIFSNLDEDHLQTFGQVFSSETSRKIYSLLVEKEMHATQIQKIIYPGEYHDHKLPIILFHLKKMTNAGILQQSKKFKPGTKKELTYYQAFSVILIVPNTHFSKATQSKRLHNTLQNVF